MANNYPATEGLQHISHDHASQGGLHYDDRATYQRDGIQPYDKQSPYTTEAPELYIPPAHKKKRICGVSRTVFILLLIIAVLVIAGAIGGGIGGSIAARSSKTTVRYYVFNFGLTYYY